jgi:NAD-dependent SIR2 family protein deacetylase
MTPGNTPPPVTQLGAFDLSELLNRPPWASGRAIRAAVTDKPQLTVVLGAGASIELGVPSTETLTKRVWSALEQIKGSNERFPWDEHPSARLRSILERAYNPATFEHVVHALEAIYSLSESWKARHGIVEGVLTGGPLGELTSAFSDPMWLHQASEEVFRVLHAEVDAASRKAENDSNWVAFVSLLKQLESAFDLHVVTLNYDDLVERALGWGAAEQGFRVSPGQAAAEFIAFDKAPRLMHLHGGLNFGYSKDERNPRDFGSHELFWFRTSSEARESWERMSRTQPNSQALRHTIVGPFITGMQKADKLQIEPYETMGRHMGNLLATHPRLLVVGFGFGDHHVNSLIYKMKRIHQGKRRVAIIDYESPKTIWRGTEATWVKARRGLKQALDTLANESETPLDEFQCQGPNDSVVETWTSIDDRLLVHLCGLTKVATHYAADLVAFLKRP